MNFPNLKPEDRWNSEIGNSEPQSGRSFLPAFVVRSSEFGVRRAAFSLIEILIVVALLSIIILGLLAMFSQTQKAFRAGLTQTDVLQAGRLAGDMLGRELEQITPAYVIGTNFGAPNF